MPPLRRQQRSLKTTTMKGKCTMSSLEERLKGVRMEDMKQFLEENKDEILKEEHAFSDYMRTVIKEKGLSQQDIFLYADIPERYGYKLISQEKHTRQRDIILRICYAANFTLEETQRALQLYQMPELIPEFARDAMIMAAINSRPGDIIELNMMLKNNGFIPLRSSGTLE